MAKFQHAIPAERWSALLRAMVLVAFGWVMAAVLLAERQLPVPDADFAAPAAQRVIEDWRGNGAGFRPAGD